MLWLVWRRRNLSPVPRLPLSIVWAWPCANTVIKALREVFGGLGITGGALEVVHGHQRSWILGLGMNIKASSMLDIGHERQGCQGIKCVLPSIKLHGMLREVCRLTVGGRSSVLRYPCIHQP